MERLPDEISQIEQRALLCAAGELQPGEAVAFERELSEDPGARRALDEARGLLAETGAVLSALQATEAVSERSMRRARDRAAKAIFSWVQVERETRVLRSARRHPLAEGMVWRYARWPLAAAAVLVVGLVIWTFSGEPVQDRDVADGRLLNPPPGEVGSASGNGTTMASGEEVRLDQIAALFDNPTGAEFIGVEFAGGLSNELAALRLLEEPDYE